MKKQLSILLFIALLINLYIDSVFALSVNVKVNAKDSTITVFGDSEYMTSISLVKDGVSFNDFANEKNDVLYFGFLDNNNGKYSQDIQYNSDVHYGKYYSYVVSIDSSASVDFMLPGTVDQSVLTSINSAQNWSELKAIVEQHADELGVDSSANGYNTYSDYAYSVIMATNKNFVNAVDFYDTYNEAFAFSSIINNQNIDEAIKSYGYKLSFDYNANFINDERLTYSSRQELLKLIKNNSWIIKLGQYSSISEAFKSEFDYLKALAVARKCETSAQLQSVMTEQFTDVFTYIFSDSTYKKLIYPEKVFSSMISEVDKFEDLNEIKSIFENCVNIQFLAEQENNSNSGSSNPAYGIPPQNTSSVNGGTSAFNPIKKTFTDVNQDFWGYDAIEFLTSKGIVSGYLDGSFKPDSKITRAEYTKLIVLTFERMGGTSVANGHSFSDVSENDWYNEPISKAFSNGFITGFNGTFNPNDFVTRQDAAVILNKMLASLEIKHNGHLEFKDTADIDNYAKDAVSSLAYAGIINGMGNGNFEPYSALTRAQASQLLTNILK